MAFQKIIGSIFTLSLVCAAVHGFPLKLKTGNLVNDVEIMDFIENLARPIIKRTPSLQDVDFYVISDPEFNAFAIEHGSLIHPSFLDRPCIFLHTGVIEREELGAFTMVLFHELGHLAGRHLTQIKTSMEGSGKNTLVGTALGCIIGGITGSMLPVFLGTQLSQIKSLLGQLRYTRGHEASADAFAFKNMLALNWPTTGALNMMLRHARKESLNYKSLYTRSHPFFADRAKALQNHAQSKNIFPQELTRAFQKIKIKVIAFSSPLHTVDSVINDAPIDDAIKPYGRAIAAYRHGKTEKALRLIDDFEQKNGGKTKYTYELRSEILLTAGRAQQSLEAMNGALAVDPKNLNFVIQKAVILFHLKRFSEMITLLQPMLSTHAHKDALWYWLGLAYERTNNKGRMYVCLAERYALMQEWAKAKHYLVLSQKVLPKTDEFAQRRNDLIFHIKENKKGSKK